MSVPTRALWSDITAPGPAPVPLDGDVEADVAVVGAGLTGLWTAHSLLVADPSLSVLVLEAGEVGFGASGRNGGWSSALFPTSTAGLARRHGRGPALAMRRAMVDAVGVVGSAAADEGIDCDYVRGGTVTVARSPAQLARARAEVEEAQRWGVDRLDLLDAEAARDRLAARGVLGGTWTPDCARVQPLKLVRGLAAAVRRRGGRIAERTRATSIEAGRVSTATGTVTCRDVVVATEGYTATLPGRRRDLVPVYSLVVATEPLPEQTWERIGLERRETFSEHRHLVVYGQRTADDRLVFGGRGAPYHFGSHIAPEHDGDEGVFTGLRGAVRDLLPALADLPDSSFTHAWGGPLGIARDWHAGVRLDPATRIASAGGYVGDGVSSTNLAGRTIADLLLGRDTDLTRLPWVGHRSPRWEPEPLRWLGVNAGLRLATWADAEERATGRPAVLGRPLAALTGH